MPVASSWVTHRVVFLTVSYLYASVLYIHLPGVVADMKTVVIDDTYGDQITGAMPVYSPPASWTQNQPCGLANGRPVNPDPSMAWNGTWHGSAGAAADTALLTIDFNFTGDWLSIYCIVLGGDRDNVAASNMSFELDGQQVGRFYRDVSGQTEGAGDLSLHYNVSVFNASVPEGQHALRISSVDYSRMLFDYVLYTTNTDLSDLRSSTTNDASDGSGRIAAAMASSSSTNAHASPAVVAGVAVAVAVVVLIIGASIFVLRRSRLAKLRRAGCLNLNPPEDDRRLAYHPDRVDDIETTAFAASNGESLSLNIHPYTHPSPSRSEDGLLQPSPQEGPDSFTPLLHSSMHLQSDMPPDRKLPRIVVMGTETRLEGPDNSMARIARQRVAEREAELIGRVHEV
ncbi:hypothetical protein C8Q73DRAFT_787474 [Cubamyces lactineus]|nr:hypothetical protein C8Q73DRAFT_787474 [Cubamyces lactineus]